MEQAIVKAVVPDSSEAKITVSGVADEPGVAARLFRALADAEANVDMIVQNTSDDGITDISFTVPHEDLRIATSTCEQFKADVGAANVKADSSVARVSVVGAGMKSNPGVAATMFETLAANSINIEMISTSPIRVSCVVAESDIDKAVHVLHDVYGLAESNG